MSDIVGLVLNPMTDEGLRSLVEAMPVWIASDAVDGEVLSNLRSIAGSAVTSFARRAGESNDALAGRIIYSLDQHFDESSQVGPYCELHVYGIDLADLLSKKGFQDVGFIDFCATDYGFVARKSS